MTLIEACRAAKVRHASTKTTRPWDEGYEAAVLRAAADFAASDESVPEHVRLLVAGYLRVAASEGG